MQWLEVLLMTYHRRCWNNKLHGALGKGVKNLHYACKLETKASNCLPSLTTKRDLAGIVTDHEKHRHLWGETKAAAPITLIAVKLFRNIWW